MRETTLLIRQLIEKDFKQRLTAAQTLDIVLNRLSRLWVGGVMISIMLYTAHNSLGKWREMHG